MIQQRANMDWMLKDLAAGVPQTRHVVVLSSDGLRMAQYGTDTDTADRLAAPARACRAWRARSPPNSRTATGGCGWS